MHPVVVLSLFSCQALGTVQLAFAYWIYSVISLTTLDCTSWFMVPEDKQGKLEAMSIEAVTEELLIVYFAMLDKLAGTVQMSVEIPGGSILQWEREKYLVVLGTNLGDGIHTNNLQRKPVVISNVCWFLPFHAFALNVASDSQTVQTTLTGRLQQRQPILMETNSRKNDKVPGQRLRNQTMAILSTTITPVRRYTTPMQ